MNNYFFHTVSSSVNRPEFKDLSVSYGGRGGGRWGGDVSGYNSVSFIISNPCFELQIHMTGSLVNTCELWKDRINAGLTKKAGYKCMYVNECVCVCV